MTRIIKIQSCLISLLAVPVFSFAGGLESVAEHSQAAQNAGSIESARELSGKQIDGSLSFSGESSPVYAGGGAGPVKSKARLSSRIDGGIENSKIPDVPESAGAAVREYLKPQGAVLDFMSAFIGGLGGYVVGGMLAVGHLEESSLLKSPLGIRILTFPLFLGGVLAAAAAGIVVGTVLGVVKMGQAVGEAVRGEWDIDRRGV